MCVFLGQVLHRITGSAISELDFWGRSQFPVFFFCPFPRHTMAQQHQGHEEDIKIVLGLEAETHQGTTHFWGLPYPYWQLLWPTKKTIKQNKQYENGVTLRVKIVS